MSAIASEPEHFGASASSLELLVQYRMPMINAMATTIAARNGRIFLLRRVGWELIIESSPFRHPEVHYPGAGTGKGTVIPKLD
ncbi:hypothetical protein GCM10017567_21740 [Amycolatopsis bullii]|uniref:Uncharacterized protein n=1 Tax=Amycolatopsis bullii TaxID=941987 RepID=A0ABQ3K7D9_9PSEU|nr:hypothetical protein GCM10017567_21740 [Amycolatopsis bullii]